MDIIGTFVEAWREAEFACEVAEKLGLCRKVTYAILQKARTLGTKLADLDWLPPDEIEARLSARPRSRGRAGSR